MEELQREIDLRRKYAKETYEFKAAQRKASLEGKQSRAHAARTARLAKKSEKKI